VNAIGWQPKFQKAVKVLRAHSGVIAAGDRDPRP